MGNRANRVVIIFGEAAGLSRRPGERTDEAGQLVVVVAGEQERPAGGRASERRGLCRANFICDSRADSHFQARRVKSTCQLAAEAACLSSCSFNLLSSERLGRQSRGVRRWRGRGPANWFFVSAHLAICVRVCAFADYDDCARPTGPAKGRGSPDHCRPREARKCTYSSTPTPARSPLIDLDGSIKRP